MLRQIELAKIDTDTITMDSEAATMDADLATVTMNK
jgi:hypothetical protein